MNALLLIPLAIGLICGIVVNYLADVLPTTRTLTRPACTHCANAFSARDYLLMGPCTQCGKQRDARAFVVLVVLALAHLYIWTTPPARIGYILSIFLTIYLATVFVVDLEHRLILHPTSFFGVILGLGVGWLSHGLAPTLLGALAGLSIMLVFYLFGMLFSRIRSRRLQQAGQASDDEEALGAGDVILATIIGLMLGWPLIWFGLLVGILLGGFVSILLILRMAVSRQYKKSSLMVFIPYGPYFIISTFLIIYFPEFLGRMVPG